MILAGAGGHALELYDLILELGLGDSLEMYDQDTSKTLFKKKYSVHHELNTLTSSNFCLGVGTPKSRKALYEVFSNQGKRYKAIQSISSRISSSAEVEGVDIFHHCFIGPEVSIGKGTLVNTGVQVHHECRVGAFSVINPGAFLLGAVQIGEGCSIGAHATILPGVKLGNGVNVGAGAVVIRDVKNGKTVVGVPGRVI
ncbi:acetyltransferase [Algoriphagus sediminis]|uniref:Acetyltransferase n=1 Tax=Algoriphagus sediminis TaxID=3057113 RepID=A0ABT7YDV9_9BACT|nr:acetyltransferase [Algoriphagus sediminis]MDN3204707.1 acetyltransferase [Algoriphagus sediminis]